MKKLILTLGLGALLLSSLAAEIDKPKRWFELGMDVDASVSENLMGLTEVMQKELVIDLPKIYKDMGPGGFKLNLAAHPSFFMNFFIKGWGVGLQTDVDFSTGFGISSEFFRLLAEGNELGEERTISFNLNMQSFISQSASLGFDVAGFRVKVTPSYFVPLLYLPDPHAALTYRTDEDGKIYASLDAGLSVYSFVPVELEEGDTIQEAMEKLGNMDSDLVLGNLKDVIARGGGFNLSASVQYPLFDFLDLGAYTTVPIVPGRLFNKVSAGMTFSAESDGIMNGLLGGKSMDETFPVEGPNIQNPVAEKCEYKVSKPFRLGVEASWRPIGNWFVVHPMLGLAMRNPVGSEGFAWDRVYPEYRIALDMTFLYVLGVNVTTEYIDQVFAHSIGLSLNTRVLELDASVGISGADFFKSFTIRGLQANVGVRIGI